MSAATGATLLLSVCRECHARYLPMNAPCPRCSSPAFEVLKVPGMGRVIAATELTSPAEGWPPRHRLALVEVAEEVRLLAIVDGPLPAAGDAVEVNADGALRYRARAGTAAAGTRGGGFSEGSRVRASL